MLANSLLRSTLNATHTASIYSSQQVRFGRKTFRLKKGVYGAQPLVTIDEFEEAKEEGKLEELSYKEIRFVLPWETGSPLFDRQYERFCKYIMKDGRKGLAHELMHETFFEIKKIQYMKIRKLKEKMDGDSLVTQDFIDSIQPKANVDDIQDEGQDSIEINPMTIMKKALINCEPLVITRKIKRGGATYQVPYPLSKVESEWYALKWMIKAVLERPKPRTKHFPQVMAQELLDAFYNRGKVIKRRDDIHRLADANKAYAHYRWG